MIDIYMRAICKLKPIQYTVTECVLLERTMTDCVLSKARRYYNGPA